MIRIALTGLALGATVALATPGPTPDPALMVCVTLLDRAAFLEAAAEAVPPGPQTERAAAKAHAAIEQAKNGCR